MWPVCSDFLPKNALWKGGKNSNKFSTEKPDRHNFSLVIKVNINNDVILTDSMYAVAPLT